MPPRHTTKPLWDAEETLEIINHDHGHRFTCRGWAPSQNRRCWNPINKDNRARAFVTLAKLEQLPLDSVDIDEELKTLAKICLCVRNHQDQARSLVKEWKSVIRDLREEQQEHARTASSRNSRQRYDYEDHRSESSHALAYSRGTRATRAANTEPLRRSSVTTSASRELTPPVTPPSASQSRSQGSRRAQAAEARLSFLSTTRATSSTRSLSDIAQALPTPPSSPEVTRSMDRHRTEAPRRITLQTASSTSDSSTARSTALSPNSSSQVIRTSSSIQNPTIGSRASLTGSPPTTPEPTRVARASSELTRSLPPATSRPRATQTTLSSRNLPSSQQQPSPLPTRPTIASIPIVNTAVEPSSSDQPVSSSSHSSTQTSPAVSSTPPSLSHRCTRLHVPRRSTNDDCGVCWEDMSSSLPVDLVWCKAQCGRSIHRSCFDGWSRGSHNRSQITCIYCRKPWTQPCEHDLISPPPSPIEEENGNK